MPTVRAPGVEAAPVAIIDIGSNSVRLVVYDGRTRSPIPLYNEKLLCGLGRGVLTTGKLPKDAVERSLHALARFRVLCEQMGAQDVTVLATAAARDASNGAAFLDAAAATCGSDVQLLTGEREAQLSAYGVMSGFHGANGIVGDLGGGSLELVGVGSSDTARGITLPLGGLALQDLAEGSLKKAQKIAREKLRDARVLESLGSRTFYAVGGTWRAIARLQMAERNYPLHVMHGYELAPEPEGFGRLVERVALTDGKLEGISDARRPLLAYGSVVLDEIVRTGRPSAVVISALGVREGLLFEALSPGERASDPLIEAASDLNRQRARSPLHGEDLRAWTDALIDSLDHDGAGSGRSQPMKRDRSKDLEHDVARKPLHAFRHHALGDETTTERRLRHAACLLADIGWRAHPDYRGDQSVALIAHSAFLGIDHPGRGFLALAVLFRHVGLSPDKAGSDLQALAGPRLLARARLLAASFRVAFAVTAGMGGVLSQTPLVFDGRQIVLTLPRAVSALANERLENRLRALGRILNCDARIDIG